jgi:RHS repeat-associated protein
MQVRFDRPGAMMGDMLLECRLVVMEVLHVLTTTYGYDNLGALTSIQYPSPSPLTLTYTLDSLERPVGLTDNTNYTWASGVQYNPASQITNALFPSGTETWMYNTLNQLYQRMTTSPSGTPLMNMTYNYTAGANNGQIASSSDAVTGEKITYTYDSLKRLVNATSTSLAPGNATIWSDAYTYDPFGNLIGMTPGGNGAPTLSQSITVSGGQPTNQFTGVSYDTNGNVTAYGPPPAAALGYDVANRLATVNTTNAYAYDPANLRVYFNTAGTETLYFYGLGGKKLATYTIAPSGSQVSFTFLSRNIYFAGKLISAEGKAVSVDRLGSVRWNATAGNHTYYPYGAEYSATSNDTEKYASYTRDSLTGLDYAMNRYYSSAWGRFMTPDPSYASMDLRIPQSWNRYMYALGDPIAGSDPTGLDDVDDNDGCPDGAICFSGGGGGGAGGDGDPLTASVDTGIPAGPGYLNPGAIGIPSVTSTFAPIADPTAALPNGDLPIWGSNGGYGQQILQQSGAGLQGFNGLLGAFAGGSVVAGAAVAGGLTLAGGLEAVSSNAGDAWLLPSDVSQTFTNGFATEVTATEDIAVQRVFSTNMTGQYWTTTPITSSSQAADVLALGPWNTATNLVNGVIPAGATYFIGTVAANQFGSGGAVQIVIDPACVAIMGPACPLP